MPPELLLPPERIVVAVEQADLSPLAVGVAEKFAAYYDLLQRWNAKLNLTAIRSPEDALQKHFVECIFCAQNLPPGIKTVLDYGSGAGFPGIPIALCRPEIRVTLAESQGKKASFLREAVRLLKIDAVVYAGRAEDLETDRTFDAVTLRAVDKMQDATQGAANLIGKSGWLTLLVRSGTVDLPPGFRANEIAIPGSEGRVMLLASKAECST